MPRPIVEKDTPTADFLNSLFLRPVWRKASIAKIKEVSEEAPQEPTAAEPAIDSRTETETAETAPSSLTQVAIRAWAQENGWEIVRQKPVSTESPRQKDKADQGDSKISVYQAKHMVILLYLLPELEKVWGAESTAEKLNLSSKQYAKLKSSEYSPHRIPVIRLLRRIEYLLTAATPGEHQPLRDAIDASRTALLSDATTLLDRLYPRIGSQEKKRRAQFEKRSRSRRATSPVTTLGSTQAVKETPRAEAAGATAAEWYDEQQ